MRYKLNENNEPERVTIIIFEDSYIVNPHDMTVDAYGAGYPMVDVPAPSYDAATQHAPTFVWEQADGTIHKVWTVTDKTADELKQAQVDALDAQINAMNSAFEAWKSAPIVWDGTGKGYLPRWITEFYTPIQVLGASAFPQSVTASDGTSDTLSFEQFSTLYTFLIQQSALETARVNALLAPLYARKAEVQNG